MAFKPNSFSPRIEDRRQITGVDLPCPKRLVDCLKEPRNHRRRHAPLLQQYLNGPPELTRGIDAADAPIGELFGFGDVASGHQERRVMRSVGATINTGSCLLPPFDDGKVAGVTEFPIRARYRRRRAAAGSSVNVTSIPCA